MYTTNIFNKDLGVVIKPISLEITPSIKTLGIVAFEGFTAESKTSPYAWLFGDSVGMLYGDLQEIIYGS